MNPDEMVAAAGSLRRIGYRLAGVAAGRPHQRPLCGETEHARRAFEDGLAQRLHAWLDYFEAGRPFDAGAAQAILGAHASDGLERTLEGLTARVAASSYAEISDWPLESRRALLAELDSFHRLVVMTGELDRQLAAIPA